MTQPISEPGYVGLYSENDNPILHQMGCHKYLTHYLLDRETGAIVGYVHFHSEAHLGNGVYKFTDTDGTVFCEIEEQTAYLTASAMEQAENNDSNPYTTYPIQMNWIGGQDD